MKKWVNKINMAAVSFALLFSCHTEYGMEHFKDNEEKFIKLHRATVDYAFSLGPSKNGSLVLYNCKKENKRLPSELCYASIEEQMHALHIKRITLSAEECTSDSIMYDKISYTLENNGQLPVEEILFDYCATHYTEDGDIFMHRNIDENWSYIRDNDFM